MHGLTLDGVSFDVFRGDLGDKTWVLLLHGDDGALCGFSSMDLYDESEEPVLEEEPEPGGEFVALIDVGGGVTNVHIVRDGVP